MKKRYSQFVVFGFSLITIFFMMACGGGGGEDSETSKATNSTPSELQTTSVEISIQIPEFSNARQLAASSEDVVRVTVDVTNQIGNVYVAAQELEAQGDAWVGQLENVPVGLTLVLKVHAYDTNGIEIYSAETSEVFTETPQPVSLEVAPVPKATASVRIQLPSSSSTARSLALATLDDIASVSLEILDGAAPVVPTVTLAESNNTWSTDPPVSELPVGVLLTFRATAEDAGSTEIFKGETTTYLHSEANNIIIFMSLAADTDGTILTFPSITQIQLPQEFAPATTGTVSITVEGSTNEDLDFEIAASGGGSFSLGTTQSGATISGTINVGGAGTTQLDTTYFAPATTNNYNNSVTMTNELGNSITWDFVTQVANPTGNVSLIFNPIITGLNVSQIATSGTSLYFVATLFEDPNQNNTGLVYDWSFANTGSSSAVIASSNNNTMTLGNYDPNTTQGTLTLIVTDPILVEGQQRQTTLRYQIPLQLFPENTIDYVSVSDISQQAYLKADNNDSGDFFGRSVSLSGGTLAVGAINEDSNQTTITTTGNADDTNTDSGAVYVYTRSGTTWSLEAYLKADNNDSGDQFGHQVSLSGDTLAVASLYEDSNQTTITTTGSADDTNTDSGAVYVYTRSGTTWIQQAYLKADNNDSGDQFGFRVSLSGDTLAVGARREDSNQTTITSTGSTDNTNTNSGAVYVYTRSGTTWSQEAYIKADNNDSPDYFGYSVSLSGDTLAVGATRESSNQTTITTIGSADNSNGESGAVYVFTRSGTTWTQQAYLKADNSGSSDTFGVSVSLSDDTLAVGANGEDSNQTTITTTGSANDTNTDSRTAYLYTPSGTTWTQQAYLKADNNGNNDNFGDSVSLSGDTLAVMAPFEDSNQTTITTTGSSDDSNSNSGAVYLYTRSGTIWTQQYYLKADNNDSGDEFGSPIYLSGETLAVGAIYEDSNQATITTTGSADNSNSQSGAVYVFDL